MVELVVWEIQLEISLAIQMVAQWTVYLDSGVDGVLAQYHVVGEAKLPQG